MIQACPECDGSDVESRLPTHPRSECSEAEQWYCNECEQHFDEPTVRESNNSGHSRKGLAGKLANIGENK